MSGGQVVVGESPENLNTDPPLAFVKPCLRLERDVAPGKRVSKYAHGNNRRHPKPT